MAQPAYSRLVLAVLALSLLTTGIAHAQAAAGKQPKRCLNERELTSEQVVRHGVFLREAGNRCEPLVPGIRQLWLDFDEINGQRFAKQTEFRSRIFVREFKDDWLKVMTYFDGRLVTYYRHYPLTEPYCRNVEALLKDNLKRGWKAFIKQSKLLANEIDLDYRACR